MGFGSICSNIELEVGSYKSLIVQKVEYVPNHVYILQSNTPSHVSPFFACRDANVHSSAKRELRGEEECKQKTNTPSVPICLSISPLFHLCHFSIAYIFVILETV